jgi:hypothetical protein
VRLALITGKAEPGSPWRVPCRHALRGGTSMSVPPRANARSDRFYEAYLCVNYRTAVLEFIITYYSSFLTETDMLRA